MGTNLPSPRFPSIADKGGDYGSRQRRTSVDDRYSAAGYFASRSLYASLTNGGRSCGLLFIAL
jgi:hypothetical protein